MKRHALLGAIALVSVLASSTLSAVALRPYKTGLTLFDKDRAANYPMAGDTYDYGITNTDYYTHTALWNLKNKYRTLTFIIGPNDNSNSRDFSAKFSVDGVEISTMAFTTDSMPEEVTLELNNLRQLKIEMSQDLVIANYDFE